MTSAIRVHAVHAVREEHVDVARLANAGDMIGRFSELVPSTRIEIFDDVSNELRQLVAPFGAEIAGHWTGLTR